uniref:Uncharacterized protein n=1 Tax=Schistosoma curassoni TaxID=6186 RepID=A0A183KAJ8_9TREM
MVILFVLFFFMFTKTFFPLTHTFSTSFTFTSYYVIETSTTNQI